MDCNLCSSLTNRNRVCWGEILTSDPTQDPEVMVIAEVPGIEEDKSGRPLIGSSGQEARHHLTINGIVSRGALLDNMVKCHPPENRDPLVPEIRRCTEAHLIPTILRLRPHWIISMGRVSTQFFLGDVTMEMVHGIPRPCEIMGHHFTLIPAFHPAAGLHDPSQMILFQRDMQIAGDVIRGLIHPEPPGDPYSGVECYRVIDNPEEVRVKISGKDPIAIDTEWARGKPFCLSVSVSPGQAFVVRGDRHSALAAIEDVVGYGDGTMGDTGGVLTLIHNAPYDLPVLDQMGIHPRRIADTMVMAYLLQDEPQGLKPLAFRHCGMEMSSYQEMVGEATRVKAQEYLEAVGMMEWDDPEPVLEWKKGEPKVRQPQGIGRKVKSALGKGDDLYGRWKRMDGTGQVEAVLGPLREGELCDIQWDEAVRYSARDADATIRVYPVLWNRVKSLGLEDTFWRDMRMMPMVVDMMRNGMPVDVDAFNELSEYLQGRMGLIQRKIQASVGKHLGGIMVNPGSFPQMSELIYDRLRLQEVGGKWKSKKSTTGKSTANDILKRYVGLHPVVQDIIDWREYQKLKTSYADAIPKMVGDDGRVRTTIRITRTDTGRLSSSNPNLMAQPTRSEEGRKVRDCYLAEEGWEFLSGDYSQVEMRVAANDAQDERMMRIFWFGEDIHAQTASAMFGVPLNQLDEMKHRYPAKRVGFGILNLITAEGLQRELAVGGAGNWTLEDCKTMVKSWFDIYPGIAAYMKKNGEQAKRYGYVRDMWGRIRYIPGIRAINRWARIEAERQAGNAPIQMGAQGIIKEAMGRLVPIYRKEDWIRPLIQIHDDIVWEVRRTRLEEAKRMIKPIMEGIAPQNFIIPLKVDFKWGSRWGSLKKGEHN